MKWKDFVFHTEESITVPIINKGMILPATTEQNTMTTDQQKINNGATMFLILAMAAMMTAPLQDLQRPYDSIVHIFFPSGVLATGSIVQYKNKRFLMTNVHVCMNLLNEANQRTMVIKSERSNYKAIRPSITDLRIDPTLDLCLVSGFNTNEFSALKLGEVDGKINILAYDPHTLKKSEFHDVKRVVNFDISFEVDAIANRAIDAKILKGMSGTPVLNSKNEIIGIVWGNHPINMEVMSLDMKDYNYPQFVDHGYITTGDKFREGFITMAESL